MVYKYVHGTDITYTSITIMVAPVGQPFLSYHSKKRRQNHAAQKKM